MLPSRIRALPLLLTTLAPIACTIDFGDLGACRGDGPRSERHELAAPVTAVIVDVGAADVVVRTHDQDGAQVDATWYQDRPGPRVEVTDGVLRVTYACTTGCCATDLALTVPAAASLTVDVGTGDVAVADLAGAVDLDLGTGDMTLERLAGAMVLNSGTGTIQGWDLRSAEARVDLGTGDVMLGYAPAAAPDRVTVEIGTGDVGLRLPDAGYDLQLSTGRGDITVSGVRDDAGQARLVAVDVGTGDIDVRGL